MRTGGDQFVLDPAGRQTISQVTDGLIIGEVCLTHPALGPVPANLVDIPLAGVMNETHRRRCPPAPAGDGGRTDDRSGGLDDRPRGPGVHPRSFHEFGQSEGQGPQTGVGDGRDLEDGQSAGGDVIPHEIGEFGGLGDVDLVQHDDTGPVHERCASRTGRVGLLLAQTSGVSSELGLNGVQIAQRVTAGLECGAVQDVNDDGAAFNMAQELQPQSPAPAGAWNKAGDVGDRVTDLTGLDDAHIRHQRGEGVVGDLGPSRAHGRDEGGLAGAGIADQRHVGDGLELHNDVAHLPRLAQQVEPGSSAPGGRQGEVAASAGAPLGHDDAGPLTDEIRDDTALGVLDDGALGNRQHEVRAVCAAAPTPHTGRAVAGGAVRRAMVGQQSGGPRVDDEHDAAAVPAVAAVGSGQRLELLAVDRCASVAAAAAAHVENHSVDETGHGSSWMMWAQWRKTSRMHSERGRRIGRTDGQRNAHREGGRPKPLALAEPDGGGGGSGLGTHDVDDLAIAMPAELNATGGRGEKSVVVAPTHVDSGMEMGSALADDNLPGLDDLPAETLDAETLSIGVAAVAGGAAPLLVCHNEVSLS